MSEDIRSQMLRFLAAEQDKAFSCEYAPVYEDWPKRRTWLQRLWRELTWRIGHAWLALNGECDGE